jgi:hypothetical protein
VSLRENPLAVYGSFALFPLPTQKFLTPP